MTAVVDARQPMRFVCRSYMAVVLTPEPPIAEWVAEIAERIKGAETFLAGAPVVLDLSAVQISKLATAHLISELEQRVGLDHPKRRVFGVGLGEPRQRHERQRVVAFLDQLHCLVQNFFLRRPEILRPDPDSL